MSIIVGRENASKALIFIIITYLITMPYDSLLLNYALNYLPRNVPQILLIVRNYIPLISVAITASIFGSGVSVALKDYGMRMCRFRYLLLSGLIPYAIYGLGIIYALIAGIVVVNPMIQLYREYGSNLPEGSEEFVLMMSLLSTLFVGSTIIALVMVGQEIGWRGLLLTELRTLLRKSLAADVLIGIMWGLWYAPLVLLYGHYYPNHRDLMGVLMIIMTSVLLSMILSKIKLRFNSVLSSAAVLGVLNALYNLMNHTVVVIDEIYTLPQGLLGALSMSTFLLILFLLRI